jgi:hypothetical protein
MLKGGRGREVIARLRQQQRDTRLIDVPLAIEKLFGAACLLAGAWLTSGWVAVGAWLLSAALVAIVVGMFLMERRSYGSAIRAIEDYERSAGR